MQFYREKIKNQARQHFLIIMKMTDEIVVNEKEK